MEIKVTGDIELKIRSLDSNTVEFEACFVHNKERIPLRNQGLRTLSKEGTLTIHNVETTLVVDNAEIKEV